MHFKPPTPWKVWAALAASWVVIALNMSAPWGVLLLLYLIPSARTGSIHFVEEVRRERSPLLYWAVMLTWTACGIYLVAVDFT